MNVPLSHPEHLQKSPNFRERSFCSGRAVRCLIKQGGEMAWFHFRNLHTGGQINRQLARLQRLMEETGADDGG